MGRHGEHHLNLWSEPMGAFYSVPTDEELAARAAQEAAAARLIERRLGPHSDVALMLGLGEATA